MHRKWPSMAYVLAMVAMLLLTACGGSTSGGNTSTKTSNTGVLDSSKKYTVNFWEAFATGANKTSLETLTKQYMQSHSNVTVVLQPYDSYATLKTKLTAAIAAGKPPAVAQVYENWATQFQQAGSIVPLAPFISGKNGLSQTELSDFYPSLLKDGQINGKQYMMPFNKSDMVLYYNVDALKKLGLTPPTTFSELESDFTKVTANDGSQWGLSLTPSSDEWDIMYKAFGGSDFVSADGKSVGFAGSNNAKAAKQAFSELAPFVKSGAIHVTKGFNWQNDFASQKSVFALSTIASYPFIKKAVSGAFQFTETPVPAGPAGQFTVLYGTNLSIFSKVDADTQVAAWDYVKYLTSTPANTAFVQQTGYMPIRQSAFNSAELQTYYSKTPARKAGPQSLNFAFVDSIVPAWDQCRNIIATNFTSVLSGQSTADDGFAKTTQSCNSALTQG
ncbi:MAG: extracellular solute-binding protein [Ktedonobacteraceae bacterium]